MKICDYYYNDETDSLYVNFSTTEDGDNYYRELHLTFREVELYSTEIIDEFTIEELTENDIIELLEQYLIDNDLPEEQSL